MFNLFVSVGTDHHQFDRLMRWIEVWAGSAEGRAVFVQHGTSDLPHGTIGASLLERSEMLDRFRACDAAVVSCGPGAVMDCRSQGRVPIVVPRDADLGEHVDNHQSAFAAVLEQQGLAVKVTTFDEFTEALGRVETSPQSFRCAVSTSRPQGVERIPELIDELMKGSPR